MTIASNAGEGEHPSARSGFWGLALGSVGVVYGDIGTSPLYAFREAAVAAAGSRAITHDLVLGVLSLILWALVIVVTLKYVLILLRADNNGEGGTLSLTALASRAIGRRTVPVMMLGIIGAALFGPVMTLWFLAIAVAGLLHIRDNPHVLAALDPLHGVRFLFEHGHIGLVTLGLVFLAVTGGEALYADLGHFGRRPIQTAWLALVLPALAINYFGQGALVLSDPTAIENPFYRLVPEPLLPAMIVLPTAATVIASQAVITVAAVA